jgi:hypothetical protein
MVPGFLLGETMRFHLIWNWRDAWRWMSIRLIAAAAGLQLTLLAFPAQLQQYVPGWLMQAAAIACLAGAALGRVTTSTPPEKTDV